MEHPPAPLHIPVMPEQVMTGLQPKSGRLYVDGTLGLGGHSEMILERSAPEGRVIGFEWDDQAASLAEKRLARFGNRIRVVRASYADLVDRLAEIGVEWIDGLLVDLGVSSLQLDRGERGFSFQSDAPLDMRMNRNIEVTAADILARASEEELADILYHYGEERQARRIARFICERRRRNPIRTTAQLADLVGEAVPKRFHPDRIHVATRTFQAVRIAVNRELDNLVRLLRDAPEILRSKARFCVITFHSLEDRIVKQAWKKDRRLEVLTGKPLAATPEEVRENPRARSARLRIAARV